MQISLLTWPPKRLVRESVLNHNLRHPEAALDVEKAPWEALRAVILAFVRHELTDYDAELRAGAYDEEKRNRLAARVTARALSAFPWLKEDPRPFPKKERGLELDDHARRLADLRTYEYHARQVLAETREPRRKKALRKKLADCRKKIGMLSHTLDSSSPPSEDYVRVYSRPTESGKDYDWFGHRLHLNHLRFCGFTCPVCRASVMASKRVAPFGQGQKRFFASCYCICVATEKLLRGLHSEWWSELLDGHDLRKKESPSPPKT